MYQEGQELDATLWGADDGGTETSTTPTLYEPAPAPAEYTAPQAIAPTYPILLDAPSDEPFTGTVSINPAWPSAPTSAPSAPLPGTTTATSGTQAPSAESGTTAPTPARLPGSLFDLSKLFGGSNAPAATPSAPLAGGGASNINTALAAASVVVGLWAVLRK